MAKPSRQRASHPPAKKAATPAPRPAVKAARAKPHAKPAKKGVKSAPKKPDKPAAKARVAKKAVVGSRKSMPARVAPPAAPAGSRPRPAPVMPPQPSVHDRAVEVFERAFQALQQRDFGRAAALLSQVIGDFSEEKEMQERARVYLSICQRQAGPSSPAPTSYEDRVGAATLAINRGEFALALTRLKALAAEDANDDHVEYMLAVVHTALGEHQAALGHLKLAVELNPDNRYLAGQDSDLEALRQADGYGPILEAVAGRRRALRRK